MPLECSFAFHLPSTVLDQLGCSELTPLVPDTLSFPPPITPTSPLPTFHGKMPAKLHMLEMADLTGVPKGRGVSQEAASGGGRQGMGAISIPSRRCLPRMEGVGAKSLHHGSSSQSPGRIPTSKETGGRGTWRTRAWGALGVIPELQQGS